MLSSDATGHEPLVMGADAVVREIATQPAEGSHRIAAAVAQVSRPHRKGAAMRRYLVLELVRSLRDRLYLVLAVVAPVGFYLLFASIFKNRGTRTDLASSVEIMIAMATFGAMWGSLSATAPRLARDREIGWDQLLSLSPIAPAQVLLARIVAAVLVALPAIVAVFLAGAIVNGVSLTAGQWLYAGVALWVGTIPFAVIGIAIGMRTTSTTAFAFTTGLYFALAALGGLWVPPSVLPSALRHVAMTLPSYNQADLGWRIAGHHAPGLGNVAVLLAWTAGGGALALLSARRTSA
jgi:ABC-2 type transport system permease protein